MGHRQHRRSVERIKTLALRIATGILQHDLKMKETDIEKSKRSEDKTLATIQ